MEKNRDKEIVKMAIKNFGCGKSYDYEDIFQTGYLGLLLAKQQYKKEKTTNPEDSDFTAFAKYAVPFIRGFLIRELQNNDELVRKPVYIKEQKRRYERSGMSVADFLEEEGKTRRSGNAWTDNQKLFECSMFNVTSLNAPINAYDDESDELENFLAYDGVDVFDIVETHFLRDELMSILGRLDATSRMIIEKEYGLTGETPKTLSQIARESGCSRQNIWSKRKVAMEQLRRKHVLKKLIDYL